MKDPFKNATEMISRHIPVCYSLIYALLAILLCGCTPARTAPMREPTTAEQESAATLKVSKIGYDLSNTIPIGLSLTNAQPYVSTEVDISGTVGSTSLPMTNEEMALAEVATSAAVELKVRDHGEVMEKEKISRRAEDDRQKVIARELDNAVEAMKDVTINDGDFIAATTFRTNFPYQIDTTPMPPATAQPIIPSIATESPAILDELVRAAAAANEILAAALNVATMAVTNINPTTAATTADGANLTTTLQPEAASNTKAAADHEQASDSEILPESTQSYALQANEIEKIPTTTKVANAIPDHTTTPSEVENELTEKPSISIEVNYDKLLATELDNIRESQTVTPTDIQETIIDSIEKSADAETTDLSKIDGLTNTDKEPMRTEVEMDNKASESMIIEKTRKSQETMTSTQPDNDKDLEISSLDAENVVTNSTNNVETQTESAVESANENETEDTIQTTTTESLETLIAVESEAMEPNKLVLISEEQVLEETTTAIPEVTTIVHESVLSTNEDRTTTTASSHENISTETTTVVPTLFFTTIESQEEIISTTTSLDVKTDDPSASEQEKLAEDIEKTTEPPSLKGTSNSITEASEEKQIVSTTSMRPTEEATTILEEQLSTSPISGSADIETSTTSIEEPITATRIPLTVNTHTPTAEPTHETPSESSHRSTDAPSLFTITTLTTEELQHLEVSANEVNMQEFSNADLTDVSPQSTKKTTEYVITTTQSTGPEATTTTTTASATEMPEIDNTIFESLNIGSTTEIREQMTTTTQEAVDTTITTTEKTVKSDDAAEPEAKIVTTTAAVEEQLFHTSTGKEHQQQQQQVITTTTEETEQNTIEDADVTTSTTTADITATAINTPEVEVTTVSNTSPETDYTTTTTTTTLSPMSLIVAEHEARSLDRTPPRVSRIVNADGVEVLTGYSIVHHMHAAALAALAAEGA